MTDFNIPLKNAAKSGIGPASSGVYILRLNGRVMKVGSAAIGIQKRMQQYYDLNPFCGLNRHINKENRDSISVTYQTCLPSACEELESKLFDKYGPIHLMPWATRRPNCTQNQYTLLI
ncbi:MAG: hypothetical protein IKB72_05050 [Ruminococcus sp.]|nr:hypothetical protein [Oscillospiraceae bacterium]MBR2724786.1 hypothetical protein [Ruminococcus sp.]